MIRKHFFIAAGLLLSILAASGQNLIKDPECDKADSGELSIIEGNKQGALTHFEENLTWNHCWKLEIKQYQIILY